MEYLHEVTLWKLTEQTLKLYATSMALSNDFKDMSFLLCIIYKGFMPL